MFTAISSLAVIFVTDEDDWPFLHRPLPSPKCRAYDILNGVETEVPACDVGATSMPCWRIVDDATMCGPAGQKLDLVRTSTPTAGTVTAIRCPT